jgi:L-asparaginase/Glu-tRNA(Gln) amidotransferase subunit D
MLPESTDFSFLETPDDLGLLQLIDPQAIRDLARDVNALTPDELGERKLIILLATGGTLAMRKVNGIRTPAFDWKEVFHPAEGLLLNRLEIRGLNAFNIDSSQMDFRHVQELAITMTWLWRNITVPFEGFVVTHGTDTMAYSSAALSLMMGQGLPFSVAYTGAQRPLDDPMSDAPINLRNAFYVLESLHRKNMAEVVVVMGTRAILATSAEKVDDTSCNAFDAPWHSYVARLDDVSFPIPLASWLNPRRDMPFAPTIWQGAYAHSLVIKSTMGQDPELLVRQISDEEVKGGDFLLLRCRNSP